MTALILDGKRVAGHLCKEIQNHIQSYNDRGLRKPGLAVICVGQDPASLIYVRNKRHACREIGIESFAYDLPEETTTDTLLRQIHLLNNDEKVDGILLQLPLPAALDTTILLEAIDPKKDVDGFHPYNLGRLLKRQSGLRPCTPAGIVQLLEAYHLSMKGKHVVIVGASDIVGRPMALESLWAGATVTICHRQTQRLETHVRQADILIVATGVQDSVDVNWLQAHQVAIDVGIHRLANGQLRGDLNFDIAKTKVAYITPVPGGVGPMTIASLLQNTLHAYQFNL